MVIGQAEGQAVSILRDPIGRPRSVASIPPVGEPPHVMEDCRPPNGLEAERNAICLQSPGNQVGPYQNTACMADAVYSIGVVSEP